MNLKISVKLSPRFSLLLMEESNTLIRKGETVQLDYTDTVKKYLVEKILLEVKN